MLRSQKEQNILDLCLYNAVLRIDVYEVRSLLSQGAMVKEVNLDENDWPHDDYHGNYTYKDKEGWFANALKSAACRSSHGEDVLEIFALLIQNCKNNNNDKLIFTSIVNEFVYSRNFSKAIVNPDAILEDIKIRKQQREELWLQEHQKSYPFLYISSEDVQFSENDNPKFAELNQLIATIYEQAKSTFEHAGFFTIGMKDKARKILNQLIELKRYYNALPHRLNELNQTTGIQSYFSATPNGLSLENILKAKRYGNLFVTHADSWKKIAPRIEGKLTPPACPKSYKL